MRRARRYLHDRQPLSAGPTLLPIRQPELAFPMAEHNEKAWGMRLYLPLQFLNGAVARAARVDSPVLGDDPWFGQPKAKAAGQ